MSASVISMIPIILFICTTCSSLQYHPGCLYFCLTCHSPQPACHFQLLGNLMVLFIIIRFILITLADVAADLAGSNATAVGKMVTLMRGLKRLMLPPAGCHSLSKMSRNSGSLA